MDESCSHCGMTVAGLRTRLRFRQRGGVPVPLPRSRVPPGGRQGGATLGSGQAGLPDRRNTWHGRTDTQRAAGPAFPPVSLLAQTLCKVREEEEHILLVAPYWPTRTWFPELMLLMTAPPWQIPLRKDLLTQRRGTLWHPRPDLWKLHVWSLDGTRRFLVTGWATPNTFARFYSLRVKPVSSCVLTSKG